jgi:hypothetical protein
VDLVEEGVYRDASLLLPHMKRLHRKVCAAARVDREERLEPGVSGEKRRWPGLVNNDTKEQ